MCSLLSLKKVLRLRPIFGHVGRDGFVSHERVEVDTGALDAQGAAGTLRDIAASPSLSQKDALLGRGKGWKR